MPTNIPGSSSSYPANVTAPSDGDTRNAASVATALGQLADRTAYLKGKAGITDDGVQIIRQVADVAALKAIGSGSRANKDVAIIPSQGLYVFDSSSSATGDDVNVIQPTSGTGRWLLVDRNRNVWGLVNSLAGILVAGNGIASIGRAGGGYHIRVTLSVARPASPFAVLATQHLFGGGDPGLVSDPVVLQVKTVSTTVFDIIAYNAVTHAQIDMSADLVGISFRVPG